MNEALYDFAIHWLQIFRKEMALEDGFLDHWFGDQCLILGLEKNLAHRTQENKAGMTGPAFYSAAELFKVDDPYLLASLIYLQWKDLVAKPLPQQFQGLQDLEDWFVTAFNRLAQLTLGSPHVFHGKAVYFQLQSNAFTLKAPKPGQEISQYFRLNYKGDIGLETFIWEDIPENQATRQLTGQIDPGEADKYLQLLSTYFSSYRREKFVTDSGSWDIFLVNEDGIAYTFDGDLFVQDPAQSHLSQVLRTIVDWNNLFLFDGHPQEDNILQCLHMDYVRSHGISVSHGLEPEDQPVYWQYKESLTIDRDRKSLIHRQDRGQGASVQHIYQGLEGIEDLLDQLEQLDWTIEPYMDEDLDRGPLTTRDFQIHLEYRHGPNQLIKGSFEPISLPTDYENFVMLVLEFFKSFRFGEMFDSQIYQRKARQEGELIYCSVVFDPGSKEYYYQTEDESIKVGDCVMVPVGEDGRELKALVTEVAYYNPLFAPMNPDKVKPIAYKLGDDWEEEEEE